MAEIFSNTFTTNINKVIVAETDKNTQIIIMKNKVELAAVNSTPTTGQYRVTIAETKNCTARLENDYKTITLLTATGNSGEIKLSINIEGKKTITKTIPVASITSSSTISTYYSEQQQLANKFTWLVKSGTSSSNMQLTDELFNLVSNNITLTADNINLEGYTTINGNFSIDASGTMSCINANISGTLNGCAINSSSINSATISGGSITIGSNFSVDNSGNLESKNATIYGRFISETLNGKVEVNDGIIDLTSSRGDYRLLLKPSGIFQYYNSNNLFIVDGQNRTIILGDSSSVNTVNIGYNTCCYFGNNYWTKGTLTMNQTSQGVQGGTQTYLSGTAVSATKFYQNGSTVTGSDIVLKDNIKEYKGNALDIISKTKVYSFNRIVNSDITEIGFIAQQVPNELLYKKGDFTKEELDGLTAEEKVKLLNKKIKSHIEDEKIKFYEKLAEKYPSFRNLDDKSTKAQINSIQEEINGLEFEAPISMINQNNIIAIMFKAIQELKSEIDKLKKASIN